MTSLSVGNTFVCLVNDVADHLRSPTCLARETEFLAVEFGSLVLRETPDPIEDPESKLQALVLLLTLTEYSSRRNDAVVGMLKWLMKSTNLARLNRVVLNLVSNKTRGRPSVEFLTDVVDMLSGFFRGSRRTAVILDSRVWFSELEGQLYFSLLSRNRFDINAYLFLICRGLSRNT